jgi:F420H(2)-dependent quinone reductase
MAETKARPWTRSEERIGTLVMGMMSTLNIVAYRLSNGRLGGKFPGGAPVLLLTTIGRKSGAKRVAPLLYLQDGNDLIIVASKGGMSQHPAWYRNLEADPAVEVEIGKQKRHYRARRANVEEKARLWPRLVEMYGSFDDYQARTTRDIPVVRLSPA